MSWLGRVWWILLLAGGLGFLVSLLRPIWRIFHPTKTIGPVGKVKVPAHVYRQPDPMIYDQYYLQSLGLGFTWDNPDIRVEAGAARGVAVDPHKLAAATDYVVLARIWNGSTSAPAVGMPVNFSYLEFGIGTTKIPIGQTTVDLAVKGAAGCPAFAQLPWTTPATPGHYCLQVELVWPDDANPHNNLGQLNTDVRPLNSPTATFAFALRNDGPAERVVRLEADSYVIPPVPSCDELTDGPRQPAVEHGRDAHPVTAGWTVAIDPAVARLGSGEQRDVTVVITAPDGFKGRQSTNVNAYVNTTLLGGVTLHSEGVA